MVSGSNGAGEVARANDVSRNSSFKMRGLLLGSTALIGVALAAPAMAQTSVNNGHVTSPNSGVVTGDGVDEGASVVFMGAGSVFLDGASINNGTGVPNANGLSLINTGGGGFGVALVNNASAFTTDQSGGAAVHIAQTGANMGIGHQVSGNVFTGSYGERYVSSGAIFYERSGSGGSDSYFANGTAIAGVHLTGRSVGADFDAPSITGFGTGIFADTINGASVTTQGGDITTSSGGTGIAAVASNGGVNISSQSAIDAETGISVNATGAVSITTSGTGTIDAVGTGVYASSTGANGNQVNIGANVIGLLGVHTVGANFTTTIGAGVTVTGAGTASRGIYAEGGEAVVINNGIVTNTASDGSAAIAFAEGGHVTNVGLIDSAGTGVGIQALNGLELLNIGIIAGGGNGVQVDSGDATITNFDGGSITGGNGEPAGPAFAPLNVGGNGAAAIALLNDGTNILDLQYGSTTGAIYSLASGATGVTLGGMMTGDYDGRGATGAVNWTLGALASMQGATFGDADDSFTFNGGTIAGVVDAGLGTDNFYSVLGAGNSASLDMSNLIGFESYDHQSGNLTLTGARTDNSYGVGAWNLSGGTTTNIAGTLAAPNTVAALHAIVSAPVTVNILNGGTVSGYVGVYFNGPATGTFSNAGTLTASGTGVFGGSGALHATNSGTVSAGLSEGISFGIDAGSLTNSGTISGGNSTTLGYGASAKFRNLTVTNQALGQIKGGTGGLLVGSVGWGGLLTVDNAATAAISGPTGIQTAGLGGLTLINRGNVVGSISAIHATGSGAVSITNAAGGLIGTGMLSANGQNFTSGGTSYAIDLANGGTVNNAGTITGSNSGVFSTGALSLTNTGTISVTGTGVGGVFGDGVAATGGLATIVNAGVISSAEYSGILFQDGTITNAAAGLLSGGTNFGFGAGVQFSGSAGGTFNNYGVATGTAGGVITGSGVNQINLFAGSTTGNISALSAGTNTLAIYNGRGTASGTLVSNGVTLQNAGTLAAASYGAIQLGGGNNTLMLRGTGDGTAANGAAGSFSLSTSTGANTLTKADGGIWTLSGAAVTPGMTINAGTGGAPGSGGVLIFDGTTGLTGTINVNGAAIRANSAGAFGTGTIYTIDPTIQYAATGSYANPIILSSVDPVGDPTRIEVDGGVIATLTGLISENGTPQPLIFSGIDGATAGIAVLTNAGNSWTGQTRIESPVTLRGTYQTISGSDVVNSGAIDFKQSDTGTFDKVISGGGYVIASGTGTINLSANHSYTGTTLITSGTLGVTGNGSIASSGFVNNSGNLSIVDHIGGTTVRNLNGTGTVMLGANTLTAVYASAHTISGVISGAGAFVKSGAGTLTVTGNNVFGGGTTVTAGTMTALNNGNGFGNGGITIASGATAEFNHQGDGNLFVRGGTIGGAGRLLFTTAAGNNIALGNNGGNVNVALAQGGVIDVQGTGSVAGSTDEQGFWTNNLGSLNIGSGATFNGVEGNIRVDALTGTGTYRGGYAGRGSTTIGVAGGSGSFSGTLLDNPEFNFRLHITKAGSGTQTLSGINSYTGSTVISGGTLALSGNGSIANSSSVTNNATFDISGRTGATSVNQLTGTGGILLGANMLTAINNANGSISGNITGSSGGFTKSGGGNLTLNGVNNYAGSTIINQGMLTGTTDSISGSNIALNGSSQLRYNQNFAGTAAQNIGGTGSVEVNNSGLVTFTGNLTHSGGLTAQAGSHLAISGTRSGAAGVGIDLSGAGGSLAVNASGSVVGGQFAAVQMASAADVINLGSITNAGPLGDGFGSAIGATATSGISFITNGGAANSSATIGGFIAGISHTAGASGLLAVGNYGIITGNQAGVEGRSGSGGLTVTNHVGGRISALNGTGISGNAITTIVNDGTIIGTAAAINLVGDFADSVTLGATSITHGAIGLGAGNDMFTFTTGATIDGLIDGGAGIDSFVVTGTGAGNIANRISGFESLTKNGTGSLTLSATNGAFGTVAINAGTLNVAGGNALAASDTVTVATGANFGLLSHATIASLGGAGNVLLGANMLTLGGDDSDSNFDGVISGTGGLTKTGTGVLTISGANAYTGTTLVEAGTLRFGADDVLSDSTYLRVLGGATLDLNGFSDTVGSFDLLGDLIGGGTLTANAYNLYGGTLGMALGGGTVNQMSGTTLVNGTIDADRIAIVGGTLLLGDADRLSDDAAVSVNPGATLDIQGFEVNIASLVLAGTLEGSGTLTAATYELQGATVNANLGTGTLNQTSGTSTLNGTSGAETVNVISGTLVLGEAERLNDGAVLAIGSDGVLDLGAFAEKVGTANLSGALNGSGTLTATAYGLAGATVNANLGSGVLLVGAGSSVLNGTAAASTVLVAGTLELGGAERLNDAAMLTIDADGVLDLGAFAETVGSASIGGTLKGTGTLNAATYGLTGATVNANLGAGALLVGTGSSTLAGTSAASTVQVAGTLVLGAAERLNDAAMLQIEADGVLDLGAFAETVGGLYGSGDVNLAGGSLTTNQAVNSTFGGSIGGNGGLVKAGSGTLNLTGLNSFTGTTSVTGGLLVVNGSLASTVTTSNGGRIGGTGTLGGLTVAATGSLAPGNSIGVLKVAGNLSFEAGSFYDVEVTPTTSDLTLVSGSTILRGGTVRVTADGTAYNPRTDHIIINSAGGVSGEFAGVTSNLAFLTPDLEYTPTLVKLVLRRNDVSFTEVAQNPNQLAVANAVRGQGLGSILNDALLSQSVNGARAAFNALSGEIYSSVGTSVIAQGHASRRTLIEAGKSAADGLAIWGTGTIGSSAYDSNARLGHEKYVAERSGYFTGFSFAAKGFHVGVAAGQSDSDSRVRSRISGSAVKTDYVGGDIGYTTDDGLNVQAGVLFGWHDIETSRQVIFTGFNEANRSKQSGRTEQYFAELGYAFIDSDALKLESFFGYSNIRSKTGAALEVGGVAALSVAQSTREVNYLDLGLRAQSHHSVHGATLSPHAAVTWERAWGDVAGTSISRLGNGTPFAIAGAGISKDALQISGGLNVDLDQGVSFGVGYDGTVARSQVDHSAKVNISIKF